MANRFFYPRPEYPRPDLQRGSLEGHDWLNLNGPWQFRFDPFRRGETERWFVPSDLEWREQIIVPFCWESLAAWGEADSAGNDNYYSTRVFPNPLEVTRENHRSALRYEVGWYRRRVQIPEHDAWLGKRVILIIGAADFFTDCWCNGKHLGHHEGGYLPSEFDLTDALERNESGLFAEVVVRVEDPMDNSQQPVGKQWRWYTTTSGIWQTVYVEPRSATRIEKYRVITDIDEGTARFEIDCLNSEEGQVEVTITAPDGHAQQARYQIENGCASGTARLESVFLWDPNMPNLYQVHLRLYERAKLVDDIRSYFGMRKIDFEVAQEGGAPAALRVNGVARFLRGALYQSYFPDGVYTATSVETLKNDIEYAKKAGFNFLRVHIKIDDPLLLYWADRLGMLLMADFPNFGEGGDTPLARERFETMMRDGIARDFNHPSIFAWCLFNETWGFGGQATLLEYLNKPPTGPRSAAAPPIPAVSANTNAPPKATVKPPMQTSPQPGMLAPKDWVQHMWELAKHLDPTRLVEDMSVCHWEHLEYYLHCDTDINSWHFYLNDYAKAKAHIEKIVKSTFVGSTFNYVAGFKHKGQPLINSEFGGVGALDGDRDTSWSFKFLTNEMRRHQQIAAYIYTELHDVEWEYNGFLNYDRTPKEFGYDPRVVNESNALPIDAPPIQQVQPGQVIRVEVASSHYSTVRTENVTLHWEMGGMDTEGRLHQNLARGRTSIRFPHRQVAHAATLELRMPEKSMLCTLLVTAVSHKGTRLADNFIHFLVTSGYPPEREERPRTLVLRGWPSTWAVAEWSGGFADRDKHRAEDCCAGFGSGFFEWHLPLHGADLRQAHRIKVLCEASSHRVDAPQTDGETFPTTLQMTLNGVKLYQATLRNHPHDARGMLSYHRGGVGAYGYLAHAFADEEAVIRHIAEFEPELLRLRCSVPQDALACGGLTIYGAECGRYPVCPTVIIEW